MAKWYKLHKKWVQRAFLGGLGVWGAVSFLPAEVNNRNAPPSPAVQSWISDAKRKQKQQDGVFIAELSQHPDNLVKVAGHRSHRSHASHYSSASGHRSHASHFSSYSAPSQTPPANDQTPPPKKQNPSSQDRSKRVEEKKQPDKESSPKSEVAEQENGKLIVESKTGIVKSIISPTSFQLDNAYIVELLGVQSKTSADSIINSKHYAAAKASLANWISGKSVRICLLDGNKAYVFVFINELECRCVNLELLRDGKLITDGSTDIPAYSLLIAAEQDAKAKKTGVWQGKSD